MHRSSSSTTAARKFGARALSVTAATLLLSLMAPLSATAAEAPVNLGTASAFGVLAGRTVTNTGPSVISGDLGVTPGAAITGFPPGLVGGAIHTSDAVANGAQNDLTTAYDDAAGRTPTESGIIELGGRSLTAGVYAGDELGLTGTLTLVGDASSVFIFQAESTIIFAPNSDIVLTGGLTACNVFWQSTSSATLGTSANVVGTVMALSSITANTGAEVEGRLLARNGAVTLDSNVITSPTNCAAAAVPPIVAPPAVVPDEVAPTPAPSAAPIVENAVTSTNDADTSVDELAPTGVSAPLALTASALLIGVGLVSVVTVRRRARIGGLSA